MIVELTEQERSCVHRALAGLLACRTSAVPTVEAVLAGSREALDLWMLPGAIIDELGGLRATEAASPEQLEPILREWLTGYREAAALVAKFEQRKENQDDQVIGG